MKSSKSRKTKGKCLEVIVYNNNKRKAVNPEKFLEVFSKGTITEQRSFLEEMLALNISKKN